MRRLKPAPVMRHTIVPSTAFGPVAIVWSTTRGRPRVLKILLSRPGHPAGEELRALFPGSSLSSCREIEALAEKIRVFLLGESVRFELGILRLDLCSSFQRSVLVAESAIPRGRVSTYGLIASQVGVPGGARAVGNALASNPFPIVVPCHRTIRGDRSIGGYRGGSEMKRALLEAEGVAFDECGRVLTSQFYYEVKHPAKRRRHEGGVQR
jgi:methylated-DNA-[protein]-cysteine S-methyltransferase